MSNFEGLSPPVGIKKIIDELFRNLKTKRNDLGNKTKITFSLLELTPEQKYFITLPPGFSPLNINILVQIDTKNLSGEVTTTMFFAALMTKNDGYIYSSNINIFNQPRFSKEQLTESKYPVMLSPNATFSNTGVLDAYIKVDHKAFDLSVIVPPIPIIAERIPPGPISSNLLYKKGDKFYYNTLTQDGLMNRPKIKVRDLSRNLKRLLKKL